VLVPNENGNQQKSTEAYGYWCCSAVSTATDSIYIVQKSTDVVV
jgi:hypothetical protein